MLETYCTRMELRLKRSFKFQYKQKKTKRGIPHHRNRKLALRSHKTLTDRPHSPHRSHIPLTARTSPHRSQTPLTDLKQLSPISHSPHRSQPTLTDLKPMWIPSLQPYVNPLPPSALPPLRFLLIDRWHTPILARPTSSKFFKFFFFWFLLWGSYFCFTVLILGLGFRPSI